MNGGYLIPPTFLKRSEEEALALATRVIKPETSEKMRYLMRLNVEKGTATQADVQGLLCRRQDRHLRKGRRRPLFQDQGAHSFIAVLPADQPRYLLLIMLDEPQASAGNPRLHAPRAGTRCRSAAR